MSEPPVEQASGDRFCDEVTGRRFRLPVSSKLAWWAASLGLVSWLVYLMATAETGPVDPTSVTRGSMSDATVLFNSSMIVFREGLEAVLILAAITASFRGASQSQRRPVFVGSFAALFASVGTWFVAGSLLSSFEDLGMRLEAITGFIAIVVLMVVLNWFVHRMYWSGWIAKHNRRRREVLSQTGQGVVIGLVALGFTSVFREGFETVLFLQNLRVAEGAQVVVQGVAIGLALTLLVGVFVFVLQQRLPYKKMLIATGILIGLVLVVMIGGTAATFQDLGWLPKHPLGVGVIPEWMGSWFEVYPTWETIGAQVIAAAFVIGSYYLAEYLKIKRPRRQAAAAARAETAAAPSASDLA